MFQIICWYNKGHDDQNKVENIAISCSNCGKETMISMNNMNTTYQYIITSFVLNEALQHVGMLWIIETHEKLNNIWKNIIHIGLQVVYGITHLFVKDYMEKCLKN